MKILLLTNTMPTIQKMYQINNKEIKQKKINNIQKNKRDTKDKRIQKIKPKI